MSVIIIVIFITIINVIVIIIACSHFGYKLFRGSVCA